MDEAALREESFSGTTAGDLSYSKFRAQSRLPDKDDAMIFEMAFFKGRLVALMAFALVWSSAQCVASCANGPSAGAGTASTEPPCHHHRGPSNQTSVYCSQPLPQADVPLPLLALTSHAGIVAINVAVVPFIRIPPLTAAAALPMIDVLRPPGLAVPPVLVLRI